MAEPASTLELEDLPLDVRDRLLCSLPDFASLRAAVLSCKALHDTYTLRKKSIFDEVVKNEAGPATRYALAVTRGALDIKMATGQEDGVWYWIRHGIEGDSDKEGEYWRDEVSLEDAYSLGRLKIVSTAEALEKEYSVRYKDRAVNRSTFSYEESFRFRRALYLIWLLAILCYSDIDSAEDSDEELEPFAHEPPLSRLCLERVVFFSKLTDKELCEFAQVRTFLLELCEHTSPNNTQFVSPRQVATHPRPHWQATPSEVIDGFHERWLRIRYPTLNYYSRSGRGIVKLLKNRNIKQLLEKNFRGQSIIEDISEGYISACQICDKSNAWIYNNSCWCRLYEVVPQESLHFLLPGRLSSNTTLGHIIDTYSVEPDFYHKLIADILAYLKGQEVGWEPQQWVCGPCIVAFLKKGMLGCFVSRLTKDKHAFNENCRDGYDCPMQALNPEHTNKFNHLCEPGINLNVGQ